VPCFTSIQIRELMSVGDMYLSAHEVVDSKTVYGLYIVYYVLYGGRNLFLAIVSQPIDCNTDEQTGICADPGLSRGLRLAWRASRKARSADEQYVSHSAIRRRAPGGVNTDSRLSPC